MRVKPLITTFFAILILSAAWAASPKPVVKDKVQDVFIPAYYQSQNVPFGGIVGDCMRINLEERLLKLDLPSILEPYLHRPGKQTWIGEHVGKFLHAGSLVWQYTGNSRLKERIDSAARILISAQLPDGYLGTYADKDRWTNWDVWSHKYNLIGLLTYYQTTSYEPALTASRKMGDLLAKTFMGGEKDIIKASWHVGMASTSVLEPMVMLYRYTGEDRYLQFCQFIVKAWDQPHGPKILASLLEHGNVHKTANGKAYEMLSNLVGLLDLYRITADQRYLQACTNAWKDIMINRHYLTGTISWGEHFQDNHSLQPDGEVHGDKYEAAGEGCVTVTWLQMNWHLLRLTGDPAYAHELERITFNSLPGAQSPKDGSVCYFIPMSGRKRYAEVSHGILPDVSCCASSIPRGLALVPRYIAGTNKGDAVVWQYIPGKYQVKAQSGKQEIPVELTMETYFPLEGKVNLTVNPDRKNKQAPRFSLQLRVPDWCSQFTATTGGQQYQGSKGQLLVIDRQWQSGDKVEITLSLDLATIPDPNKGSEGMIVQRGPQVLAVDDMLDTVSQLPSDWLGKQFYVLKGKSEGKDKKLHMVPFADAGQTKGHYQVVVPKLDGLQYSK